MSSSLNRRGINVSAYLQNLNTLPSADEQVIDSFNPEELDIWTNTQFFDFDMGQVTPEPTIQAFREQRPAISITGSDLKDGIGLDQFLDEFKEFDRYNYQPTFVDYRKTETSSVSDEPHKPPSALSPTGTQTTLQTPISLASISSNTIPNISSSPSSNYSVNGSNVSRGLKRKSSLSSEEPLQTEHHEDASRMAAEEDKRRRNTAASARFRIKKKQKEQQLEKTAKEMTDRVTQLEQRNQQLEMEIKWLKGLIVEKNGGKNSEGVGMPASISTGSKDGIGTSHSSSDSKSVL